MQTSKGSSAAQICGGNGVCQLSATFDSNGKKDGITGDCVCTNGFGGAACEARGGSKTGCPSSWSPRRMTLEECGGADHGTCDVRTNSCSCNDGFAGEACSQRACPSINDVLCAGNGRCNFVGMCLCEPGFYGSACQCHKDSSGKEICVKDAGAGASNAPNQPPNTDNLANDVMGEAADAAAAQRKRNIIIGSVAAGLLLIVVGVLLVYHRHRPAFWAKRLRIAAILNARVLALERQMVKSAAAAPAT